MRKVRAYGCAVEFALDVLDGKWKPVILARLKDAPLRYGELGRRIPGLSDKMLTQRLRELEDDGLIVQEDGGDGARRYALSARGATLRPLLQSLHDWGRASAASFDARFRDAP